MNLVGDATEGDRAAGITLEDDVGRLDHVALFGF